ncbi:MAG: zinc-binding alcohol dehydrogenase [Desulfobacteraceae bacterium]|nr:MAG: zinc-binding alcohol dehydrogenase [Desulfobacteraceae bacterium]
MKENITSRIIELESPGLIKTVETEIVPEKLKSTAIIAETIYTAVSPGTELGAYKGNPPLRPGKAYPRLLGYCNLAEVIHVGDQVQRFKKGDKILTLESHRSHFVMDETDFAILIRNEIGLKKITTAYLFHIAYNALLKGEAKNGSNIAIVGIGTLGMTALLLSDHFGYNTFAFTNLDVYKPEDRLWKSVKLFRKDEKSLMQRLYEVSGDVGMDLVVSTSNDWNDWLLALQICRKGGTILVIGFPGRSSLPNFNPLDSQYFYDKQITIKACGYSPHVEVPAWDIRYTKKRNMELLVRLIQENKLPAERLISFEDSWINIEKVYAKYMDRKSPLFTCLLHWR